MISVSIIGTGKMGLAIADLSARAGAHIQIVRRKGHTGTAPLRDDIVYAVMGEELTGDLVVLAVPHRAVPDVVEVYRDRLEGKIVIDITNPIDFTTFDGLDVPVDSSAAGELARAIPDVAVVKAFNINFGETLSTGMNGSIPTTVIIAGDDVDAKLAVAALVVDSGLRVIDIGLLSRARELEALGFLQITLAALAKTKWETGFALMP